MSRRRRPWLSVERLEHRDAPAADILQPTIAGPGYAGASQANASGAAGRAHLVGATNWAFQVVRKDGTGGVTQPLSSLFGGSATGTAAPFDPRVVYDQTDDRFVMVAARRGGDASPQTGAALWVAVSKTADPTQGWHVLSLGTPVTADWLDYPQVAVDGQYVYLTANLVSGFPGAVDAANGGQRLFVLPKGTQTNEAYTAGLYFNGAPDSVRLWTPPAYTEAGVGTPPTLSPARVFGGSSGTAYLVASGPSTSGGAAQSYVYTVSVPASGAVTASRALVNLGSSSQGSGRPPENNASSPVSARVAGDTSAATLLPVSTKQLDLGPRRVYQAVWRNNRLSFAEVVERTGPGAQATLVQWAQVDTTTFAPVAVGRTGGPTDADWAFYPALADDAAGNLAIGFSGSGPDLYAGAYAVALPRASNGTFSPLPVQAVQPGQAPTRVGYDQVLNRVRWGDQSSLSLDPDGQTFWAFNQYAATNGEWATKWGRFVVGNPPAASVAVADAYTSVASKLTGSPTFPGTPVARPPSQGLFANDRGPGPLLLASAASQTVSGSTLTIDPRGGFSFTPGTTPGTFSFPYTVTDGYAFTSSAVTFTVLDPGRAGLVTPTGVSGVAWVDDGDGVREPDEPVLAGVAVELLQSGTPVLNIPATTTDAAGRYTLVSNALASLAGGSGYAVRFRPPPAATTTGAYAFTTRAAGTNPQLDSDPDATTGVTPTFSLAVGEQRAGVDAGLVGAAAWFGWANRAGLLKATTLLAHDAAGNSYVAGVVRQTSDLQPGLTAVGLAGSDSRPGLYVAKLSPTGAVLWAVSRQPSSGTYALDATALQFQGGRLYLGGGFSGSGLDFGAGGSQTATDTTGYLLTLSADDGSSQAFALPTPQTYTRQASKVLDLAVDASGHVAAGGYVLPLNRTTGAPQGPDTAWAARLTAALDPLWTYQPTSGDGVLYPNFVAHVAVAPGGTVYVLRHQTNSANNPYVVLSVLDPATGAAGLTRTFNSAGVQRVGTQDGTWTTLGGLAYAPDGTLRLAFNISGPTRTYAYSFTYFDLVTNSYQTVNDSQTFTPTSGGVDAVVYTLAPLFGLTQVGSAKQVGGVGDSTAAALAVGPDSTVYLTSRTFGHTVSGSPVAKPTVVRLSPDGSTVVRPLDALFGSLGGYYVGAFDVLDDGSPQFSLRGDWGSVTGPTLDLDPGPNSFTLGPPAADDSVLVRAKASWFGALLAGTVSGRVWFDANGNGQREAGEAVGPAGVPVEVLSDTGAVIASTTTATDGTYSLTGDKLVGRLSVRVRPPLASPLLGSLTYRFGPAVAGGNDFDAGGLATVPVDFAATASGVDAGLVGKPAAVGWAAPLPTGTFSTTVSAVATDFAGNVYATGRFLGTVDFDPGPAAVSLTRSAYTGYLAKYSPAGSLLWVRELGGGANFVVPGDLVYDLERDELVLAGQFRGTGDFLGFSLNASPAGSNSGAYLLRVRPDGTARWARAAQDIAGGATVTTPLTAVTQANGGLTVWAVQTTLAANVNPGGTGLRNGATPAGQTALVSFRNGSSTPEAVNLLDTSAAGTIRPRLAAQDGEVFLAGGFTGSIPTSGGFTLTASAGGSDAFILAFDRADPGLYPANGTAFGSAGTDRVAGITVQTNIAYLAGTWNGTSGFVARSFFAGAPDWQKTTTGGTVAPTAVAYDPATDTVYAGGTATGSVTVPMFTADTAGDQFIWALSGASGTTRRVPTFAGSGVDSLAALAFDPLTNSLIAGGTTGAGLSVGSVVLPAGGGVVMRLAAGKPAAPKVSGLASGSTVPKNGVTGVTNVRIGGTAPAVGTTVEVQGAPAPASTVSGKFLASTTVKDDGTLDFAAGTLNTFLGGAASGLYALDVYAMNLFGVRSDPDPTNAYFTLAVGASPGALTKVEIGADYVTNAGATGVAYTDLTTAGGQRSRITSLALTFERAATTPTGVLAAGVLQVVQTKTAGGATVNQPVAATLAPDAANRPGTVRITFVAGQSGLVEGGATSPVRLDSLVDGRYDATLDLSQVVGVAPSLNGAAGGTFEVPAGDAGPVSVSQLLAAVAGKLFRLFGDANGSAKVTQVDYAAFGGTYLKNAPDPAYRVDLDFNGDGRVTSSDYAQFSSRFNVTLP